ncbi:oxygenase MpaB family protein [Sciscionella sediminilitoris]|uniref:oxygenase MpaB family protein n=1 Tax=Sciscionella sediminilitoris TaxID=1445613 RepID=UPI0004DF23A7|nr:oxygenase MpaB family protein [Sciscionella sp. SE31]
MTETLEQADEGLVGPRSVTWQVHADPAMWVGGIRSLFLQALHPRAVAGVVQNSDYRTDPLGRLRRTGQYVDVTTYGTTEQAHAAGARVRAIHERLRATDPVTGERFRIDEPELLCWVHCAEVVSFVDVVRLAGMRLAGPQLDRYFREQRAVAALVGLDEGSVPGSVAGIRRYFARMRPELAATQDALEIYEFLHRPPLDGPLRLGLGVYERLLGHLAYSLLPGWAIRLYGLQPYPRPAALALLRALRGLALLAPSRTPFLGHGPGILAALRRLGAEAEPSPRLLPAD